MLKRNQILIFTLNIKYLLWIVVPFLMVSWINGKHTSVAEQNYLTEIKNELIKEWPNNRRINLVFHGHSVPSGYYNTPFVDTFNSYPFQVLKKLKQKYPYAVINVINTSIGGETSIKGQNRFESEVLNHKPDILFIDYALNDRTIGLEKSKKALIKMITRAKKERIKIILLTPSPDLNVDISDSNSDLEQHAKQIMALAKEYNIGLVDSYSAFKRLKLECDCLINYMSQSNHPNTNGHSIIANEIMRYF